MSKREEPGQPRLNYDEPLFRHFASRACRVILGSAVLAACIVTPGVAADSASAAISVTVVESVSHRAVPRAHVRLLSDALAYDGFTDPAGVVRFPKVTRGTYGVRVQADGYDFGAGTEVTAGDDRALIVTGVRTKPTRIGSVSSKTAPKANAAQSLAETDPAALVKGGVGPGLETLPALGHDAASGSLLIHNHDGTTTATTLNGAPVIPSGTRNQFGLLGSDIFSSAALGASSVAGAPNGTLDVRTYDPTVDWTGVVQQRAASFGGTALAVRERGTAGRIGLALVHAQAELGKPLDGLTFADTSGSPYTHHENALSWGDTFTARYGFDPNHVALFDLGKLGTTTPLTCDILSGSLPCGYGPGNRTQQTVSYAQIRDTLTLDRATVDVHLFQSRTQQSSLFAAGTVAAADFGLRNDTAIDRRGYLATVGMLHGSNRVVTFRVSSYHDQTRTSGSFLSPSFAPPSAAAVSSFSLDVPLVVSRGLTIAAAGGRELSAGTGSNTLDVRATYDATRRDTVTASFRTGHLGVLAAAFGSNGLDGGLTFDCDRGAALGTGPLLAPGSPSPTTQTRLGLRHARGALSLSVEAYRDVNRDAAVNAIVPATSLPGALLPPGSFAAASQAAAAACGRPLTISSTNLFDRVTAPVDRVVTDGVDASAELDIGPRTHLQLAYALSRARPFGRGFAFAPGSDVVAGSQLPMLPLHQESAKLTYAMTRTTTLLGILNYSGSNNAFRTRPITVLDAGARFATFSGDLTVGVQNLTNADAGPFARFDPFPALTTPVAPRTYSVRYRFAVGRQGIDKAAYLSPSLSTLAGFAFVQHDFEPPRGANDWLAPDTESPLCGAEHLPRAREYQDAIRAYDARIREARSASPRLARLPDASFDALQMSYVPTADGYAIRLRLLPGQARKINPFTRCTRIHAGSYDDAVRLRLYAPGWQERESQGFVLFYAPQAGVYFTPQAADATGAADRDMRLGFPAKPPADPFAVHPDACPATYRPAVEDALRSLKTYISQVYTGGQPSPPAGFVVAKHASPGGLWLELRADDRAFGEAIVTCLDVPTVTPTELAARRLSGANFPSFDYAEGVGFYRATASDIRKKP